jgi:hypothetical protein
MHRVLDEANTKKYVNTGDAGTLRIAEQFARQLYQFTRQLYQDGFKKPAPLTVGTRPILERAVRRAEQPPLQLLLQLRDRPARCCNSQDEPCR